jgi:hypothetical protein
MSAREARDDLLLAGCTVLAVKERVAVRDTELLTILGCDPFELRAAIRIASRWRQVDRHGQYLVPARRRRRARRSA